MRDKFESLPRLVKQTGIITHEPSSGLPHPMKSPSESREEIEDQMKKVLHSAQQCPEEEVHKGRGLDMPTLQSMRIPQLDKSVCYSQMDGSKTEAEGSSEGEKGEDMEEGEVKSSSDVEIVEVVQPEKKRKKSLQKFNRDRKKYNRRKKIRKLESSSSEDEDQCIDQDILNGSTISRHAQLNVSDAISVSSSPKESATLQTSTPIERQSLEVESAEKSVIMLGSTKQLRIAKGLEGDNPSPNVSIFDESTEESVAHENQDDDELKDADKTLMPDEQEEEEQGAPEEPVSTLLEITVPNEEPMSTLLEITVPNEDQFTSEDEETVASPREPKRSEKSMDKTKDDDDDLDEDEPVEKPKGPLHPLDEVIQKLYVSRICFSKLEEGQCSSGFCPPDVVHDFTPEDVFDFYKIIRFRGTEHLLPKVFKPQTPKRQIERLLSIYQNNIKKIIITDKAKAVTWLHDVLEDLLDLAYEKDTIHEVCRQLSKEFAELHPSDHFIENYCSGQVQDLPTITAIMEKFVIIAHKIRSYRKRQLPVELAYSEFHKSIKCGLTLQPKVLEFIWEIFLATSDKQHLPYIVNYVMLRPDTCQEQFISFLCNSFADIYSMTKEVLKPKIMLAMKPCLMAMDMKLFVRHTRESIQSLASFLAQHVDTYPDFIEVLERIKTLVGDVVIVPELPLIKIDMAEENQILALIEDEKWGHIASIYLDKNVLRLHECSNFIMILFRLFTEEDNPLDNEGPIKIIDNPLAIEGPIKIISEIFLKRREMLLPIDKLILGQLMASFILHYYQDIPKSTKLVQTSIKYGLDLLNVSPLFNPKAESEAIQTKRNRSDIHVLVVRAFILAPDLDHFKACDLLIWYFQEFIDTQNHEFIYELTKKLFDAILEVKDQAEEYQLEKYCSLFDKCLLPFKVDIDIIKYFNSMIHALIGAVHRIKNYAILQTLIYQQLEYFESIAITDESTIRGIVHMFQGYAANSEAHIWAERAFAQGLQIRAYPIQEIQYKEIVVYSHYSQYEMQQIMQDAFNKILQHVGTDKILEMYRAIEDEKFDDQTCKLDYLIRVENAVMPPKTNLSFLSVFDVSTPKTVRNFFSYQENILKQFFHFRLLSELVVHCDQTKTVPSRPKKSTVQARTKSDSILTMSALSSTFTKNL